jgi:hypothetical protein
MFRVRSLGVSLNPNPSHLVSAEANWQMGVMTCDPPAQGGL